MSTLQKLYIDQSESGLDTICAVLRRSVELRRSLNPDIDAEQKNGEREPTGESVVKSH